MLSNSFIQSPSLVIQQSLTLFHGTPPPRCEWREALASCSFRHGYHVFIPLINIKTKIINKYPIVLIILFFCIKLIGFLVLVWTHSTLLPTDRYSARDIELVACRDGAPNRTGVAQGIWKLWILSFFVSLMTSDEAGWWWSMLQWLISYITFALVLIGTHLSSLPMLARGRRWHNRHEQPMTCWFLETGY